MREEHYMSIYIGSKYLKIRGSREFMQIQDASSICVQAVKLFHWIRHVTTSVVDFERRRNQFAGHVVLIVRRSQENCKNNKKYLDEIKDIRVIRISGYMRL